MSADGVRRLAGGWEAVSASGDARRVVYWRRRLGPRATLTVTPDGEWAMRAQARRFGYFIPLAVGVKSTPAAARRAVDRFVSRRACSSCGEACLWAEDAWTCLGCGDEWLVDHGLEYVSPGALVSAMPLIGVRPEVIADAERAQRERLIAATAEANR